MTQILPAPTVHVKDGIVFANSRDVADFFGKRHDHVLRDVDQVIENISSPNLGAPWFRQIVAFDEGANREIRSFDMTRDGFTLLVMGYTGPKAMEFKVRYIQQFNDMEESLRKPALPDLSDPVVLQTLILEQCSKRIEAERRADVAERKVEAASATVAAFDRIAGADNSMCVTDAAKTLQIRPKALFDWMSGHGWTYRRPGKAGWLAYQDKIQAGLLEHKVATVSRPDGTEKVAESVRVTGKGLAKLARAVPGAKAPTNGGLNLDAAE
ncbi:Rha family transcriptional regulator [Pararhodospirillum photometricum]|uniref:Uncharacterized phage-encoded protein-like n=1 Tax=Pararhodospirillum photometricum DSM 122 TaxID=1150469 RepID=H6SL13_PARPM|nr:phage regulatory protein/antirepressor Ant [Pararhodospirillum photometricum]CCG08678.1 Uncharacterized phage-encoded protein-like [Pararhodospirillum photometricum DSM 122]